MPSARSVKLRKTRWHVSLQYFGVAGHSEPVEGWPANEKPHPSTSSRCLAPNFLKRYDGIWSAQDQMPSWPTALTQREPGPRPRLSFTRRREPALLMIIYHTCTLPGSTHTRCAPYAKPPVAAQHDLCYSTNIKCQTSNIHSPFDICNLRLLCAISSTPQSAC